MGPRSIHAPALQDKSLAEQLQNENSSLKQSLVMELSHKKDLKRELYAKEKQCELLEGEVSRSLQQLASAWEQMEEFQRALSHFTENPVEFLLSSNFNRAGEFGREKIVGRLSSQLDETARSKIELASKLDALEKTHQKNEQRLAALAEERRQSQETERELRRAIDRLERDLEERQNLSMRRLPRTLDAAETEVRALREQLTARDGEMESIRNSNAALQNLMTEMRTQFAATDRALKEAIDREESLKRRCEILTETSERERREIKSFWETYQENLMILERANTANDLLKGESVKLQAANETLQQNLREEKSSRELSEKQNEILMQKLETRDCELRDAREMYASLRLQMENLETETASRTQFLQEKLRSSREQFAHDNTLVHQKLIRAEETIARQKLERETEKSAHDRERERLSETANSSQTHALQLESQLEMVKAESETLRTTVSSLECELSQIQEAYSAIIRQHQNLVETVKSANDFLSSPDLSLSQSPPSANLIESIKNFLGPLSAEPTNTPSTTVKWHESLMHHVQSLRTELAETANILQENIRLLEETRQEKKHLEEKHQNLILEQQQNLMEINKWRTSCEQLQNEQQNALIKQQLLEKQYSILKSIQSSANSRSFLLTEGVSVQKKMENDNKILQKTVDTLTKELELEKARSSYWEGALDQYRKKDEQKACV